MDITEVILNQHHEQRRTFALLDDLHPAAPATLSAVWQRLKILLEVHAKAEELFFYPELLRIGAGLKAGQGPGDETEDYHGDGLDWYTFDRDPVADNAAPPPAPTPVRPTPVTFPGMHTWAVNE